MTAKPCSSKKRPSSSLSSVPLVVIEKVIFAPRPLGQFQARSRRRLQHRAVDQRLAAEEGQIEPGAGLGGSHQQIHRAIGVRQLHVLRGAAELALLGVAVGAAEIALLRDRQRAARGAAVAKAACRRSAAGRQDRPGAAVRRWLRFRLVPSPRRSSRTGSASASNSRLPSATKRWPPGELSIRWICGVRGRRYAHVVTGVRAVHGFLSVASTTSGPS